MIKRGTSNGDVRPVMPPQAVPIEAQVLGAALVERSVLPKLIEVLTPEDFYAEKHRHIFDAMVSLFQASQPIDSITVVNELKKLNTINAIGGESYLIELSMGVTSTANVEFHAKVIIEKALARVLHARSSRTAQDALDPTQDIFELLDRSEQSLYEITERTIRRGIQPIQESVISTLEEMERLHGLGSAVTGVTTGFRELDRVTAGWQKSDLIIIAGRPSSGKTAFALCTALGGALKGNAVVGVFSLEMALRQLVMRMLCAEALVDAQKVRTGTLPESDWRKLAASAQRVSGTRMLIDDTAGLSIMELRAKARRLKMEKKVDLIIVDYLQLMQGPREAESREREIAAISRQLKMIAKELDVPVIALAQLSRAVEMRNDKRPILSDLRESGAIEQDADVVIFVHRPEMYMEPKTPEWEEVHGVAEAIVAKQRNGPTEDVKLKFTDYCAKFEDQPVVNVMHMPKGEDKPF